MRRRAFTLDPDALQAAQGQLPTTALPGSRLDVGSPPLDRENESFLAKDVYGTEHRVSADLVFLLKLFARRDRTVPPLPGLDPRPKNVSQLLVSRYRRAMINTHMIRLDKSRGALICRYLSPSLILATLLYTSHMTIREPEPWNLPPTDSVPGGDQLSALQAQFRGFSIWREISGERCYYSARRRYPSLHPHTLVTSDPDELRDILTAVTEQSANEYPQAIADDYPGWAVREDNGQWVAACPAVAVRADSAAELRTAIEQVICDSDDRA